MSLGPSYPANEIAALARELREDERFPLARFRCAVDVGCEIYRLQSLDPPPECYWPAANMGAKTRSISALMLAWLSGYDHLLDWDGGEIPIPVIPPPVAGALVVPSFKLASGSVVAALRELLGSWPAHEGKVSSAQDAIAILYVKHRLTRSDDFNDWSRLYLFPHEGEMPDALRLDFAASDEPPPEPMWRKIRNRAKKGRPFHKVIGATPWERRFWQWLWDDFPLEFGKIEDGRVRFESSVWDNKALHRPGCDRNPKTCVCPDILRQVQNNRNNPHRLAALYGKHVDASFTCPYEIPTLMEMAEDATPGVRCVANERFRDGQAVMGLSESPIGDIRLWGKPAPHDRMLVLVNPSAGVAPSDGEKGSHLAGLWAVSIAQQRLLGRFMGYCTPPEMGLMARAFTNSYADSIFVPEMNGGWGEECLRSWQASPEAPGTWSTIYRDVDPTSTTGHAKTRVGWWSTSARRAAVVSAGQRAIIERSIGIPSRDALSNLMMVTKDTHGRYDDPDTGPHPRDFILLGMAASIMENANLLPPRATTPDMDPGEAFRAALGIQANGTEDGWPADTVPWR